MLESMVHAPTPTRAEASDVANAVFDGTSALMLSGESAIGADPANAVGTMARIARRADQEFDYEGWAASVAGMHAGEHHTPSLDDTVTNALSMAAWRAATEVGATAILCITRTGFTVRAIARFRPEAKILGFSSDERTIHQLSMSWGATPHLLDPSVTDDDRIDSALAAATEAGEVRSGDLVCVVHGSRYYPSMATDTLRLVAIT
jgi:pyruvate kinase